MLLVRTTLRVRTCAGKAEMLSLLRGLMCTEKSGSFHAQAPPCQTACDSRLAQELRSYRLGCGARPATLPVMRSAQVWEGGMEEMAFLIEFRGGEGRVAGVQVAWRLPLLLQLPLSSRKSAASEMVIASLHTGLQRRHLQRPDGPRLTRRGDALLIAWPPHKTAVNGTTLSQVNFQYQFSSRAEY